jgi:hypothetical protein
MSEQRPGLSRRHFLVGAAGVGLPLALSRLHPLTVLVKFTGTRSGGARLAALLQDPQSAGVVGRAYLREAPREADVPTLVQLVAGGLPGGVQVVNRATDNQLRELITVRIREDFAEDRTVTLQGWIVSQTEARLFAVAALVI